MKRLDLDSVKECNEFLRTNRYPANGKNIKVEYLYATAAKSRWCYENLWGIYLAKPAFAWMALWMALTSRTGLKKRQIQYNVPQVEKADFVGSVSIFNPENADIESIICQEAYLYLFDLAGSNFPLLDISEVRTSEDKEAVLRRKGFEMEIIKRRGRDYAGWTYSSSDPLIVEIDQWQMAVVNVEQLIPCAEVTLTQNLIRALAERIQWLPQEVGEDYIVN